MALFKRKDACVSWLEKLDKVYTDALRSHNARLLEPYLTRKCLTKMVEKINSSKDELCGLERYREVSYTLKQKNENQLIYLKSIHYKNVNMGYGITVPVGEAANELWCLEVQNNKYIVAEIKGV